MTVRFRVALLVVSVLLGALTFGTACSNKSDSSAPFCAAVGDSSKLFGQLDIKGHVDRAAFKSGLADMVKLAPESIHPTMLYIQKVYNAYFEVGDGKMSVAEFQKRFPPKTVQDERQTLDTWMRKNCGFGLPS